MECEACHFDGYYKGDWGHEELADWIELEVVERGPFFMGTPDIIPSGSSVPAIKRGKPTRLLACPRCGAVKIELD
jgi:hypothetical protein